MGSEEFVKVYKGKLEGPNRRGRPLGRWRDRMGYLGERGINGSGMLEEARRGCWDRERWRFLCHGHPPRTVIPTLLLDGIIGCSINVKADILVQGSATLGIRSGLRWHLTSLRVKTLSISIEDAKKDTGNRGRDERINLTNQSVGAYAGGRIAAPNLQR